MHARSMFLSAVIVLAGVAAPSSVMADVDWTGPGWYVEENVATDIVDVLVLMSGPYSDEATCNAAKTTTDDFCKYESSDPTKGGS